jgi:hypothetical protein
VADRYTTQLSPEQERAYQAWRANLPADLQNESDYDLRGAFLASVQADGRAHMTDRFKKPNHITFSSGSQYSTPAQPGGQWMETGTVNALAPQSGNSYVFWASPENANHHSMNALSNYFNRHEQGNSVVYPLGFRLPRGQ